jgi:hypothetical protein
LGWIIELVVTLFGYAVAKDEPVGVQEAASLGCFIGLAVCGAALWFLFVLIR